MRDQTACLSCRHGADVCHAAVYDASAAVADAAVTVGGALQALAFAGGLVQRFPWIRDRMIFDDKYLFKVLAECVIDCGE
jgi:hypothetical protein